MDPSLLFLSSVSDRLEPVSFDLIKKSIEDLRDKFVPIATLRKGTFIDRARLNKPGEMFKRKEEVSYIHDEDKLKNIQEFGRANLPGQAVFYGSIISPEIPQPRLVAYLETTDWLKQNLICELSTKPLL